MENITEIRVLGVVLGLAKIHNSSSNFEHYYDIELNVDGREIIKLNDYNVRIDLLSIDMRRGKIEVSDINGNIIDAFIDFRVLGMYAMQK